MVCLSGLGAGTSCDGPRAPAAAAPPSVAIRADSGCGVEGRALAARLDSLARRSRAAGAAGDLVTLHAVSDTMDSLERCKGR
jgi:hypothetical protein